MPFYLKLKNKQYLNKFILGDCLNILKEIPDNYVDMIYLDPPFATRRIFYTKDKNTAFEDLYDIKSLVKYLEPRLILMIKKLKNTGLLYFHGNDKFIHYIKILLDKILGSKNYRNEIIWVYNSAPRSKKDFGRRHDVILRYSKSPYYYFNPIRVPYSLSAPRGYAKEKYYHKEGKVIGDVWTIPIIGQNDKTERSGYPTQKPLELLKLIIESSCPIQGIIMDPFAGSGTALISAKNSNRSFIGIDMSLEAKKHFSNRLIKQENRKI